MAPVTIPTVEPSEAIAGLTWRWDTSLSKYSPADGWALKYTFRGAGLLDLTGAANAANTGWELTASATATSTLLAGVYTWIAYVELSGEKFIVGSGRLTVLPNPLIATASELQPYAEKALAHVEATLLKRYQVDLAQYTVAERETMREDIEKLEAARSRLHAEIEAQRSDGTFGRRVEYRPRSYR